MKQIKMIYSVAGESNASGTEARKYLVGEILPTDKAWQKALAKSMIERGAAIEVQGNAGPEETKAKRKKAPDKNKGALCQEI